MSKQSWCSKEELNRAANAAKHEGLGIDDPEEGSQTRDEKRKDDQDSKISSMSCMMHGLAWQLAEVGFADLLFRGTGRVLMWTVASVHA